ncbi:MAG: hypothetical protein R3E91_05325 [Chlamydiales bacterium]
MEFIKNTTKKMKYLISFGVLLFTCYATVDGYTKDGQYPYIGLITNKIDLDGIEVSDFKFQENEKKIMHVNPNEEFTCSFHYEIDGQFLDTLHLHHLVIGLYDNGPENCVLHSLGIMNSIGDIELQLKAPNKRGTYEVRLSRSEGISCQEAEKEWWKESSRKTVLGVIIVL